LLCPPQLGHLHALVLSRRHGASKASETLRPRGWTSSSGNTVNSDSGFTSWTRSEHPGVPVPWRLGPALLTPRSEASRATRQENSRGDRCRASKVTGPGTHLDPRAPAMVPQLWASALLPLLLAGLAQPTQNTQKMKVDCYNGVMGTIYEYGALTLNNEEYVQFKQYAGKHVLFVNVATY
uniref:Glutathione peroxidase 6 n=1 Tax=Canis lupus familiaris TaxID=9615 RepID=A0A8C0P6Z9_CANLF